MFKLHTVISLLLGTVSVVVAQTNTAAFFRISSQSHSVITDFDPFEGTMSWSNSVAGTTNQVQQASELNGSGNWVVN